MVRPEWEAALEILLESDSSVMSFPIVELAWAGALTDVTLLGILLFRARNQVLGVGWGARSAAMLLAWALLRCVLLAPFGLDPFGVVHIAYLGLVVVAPTCGAMVLIGALRLTVSSGLRGVASVLLLGAPVGVYATFYEPFRLQEEYAAVSLRSDAAGRAPLRVGVLADLQAPEITDYERDAVHRLLEGKPDLVLIPGDVLQPLASEGDRFAEVAPAFRKLLASLAAVPGGAFVVLGNVDPPTRMVQLVEGTGVRLLVNEMAEVTVNDRTIQILGLELNVYSAAAQQAVRAFALPPTSPSIRLLVSHVPDAVFAIPPDGSVDLVVAGHTHGGQVVLPGFGPPLTLTAVPRASAAGGLSQVRGSNLYVSRGVGLERWQAPRIRFLCPPEITQLTLK